VSSVVNCSVARTKLPLVAVAVVVLVSNAAVCATIDPPTSIAQPSLLPVVTPLTASATE
jgi:hypothetical protein